jgi:hypothetical protein
MRVRVENGQQSPGVVQIGHEQIALRGQIKGHRTVTCVVQAVHGLNRVIAARQDAARLVRQSGKGMFNHYVNLTLRETEHVLIASPVYFSTGNPLRTQALVPPLML